MRRFILIQSECRTFALPRASIKSSFKHAVNRSFPGGDLRHSVIRTADDSTSDFSSSVLEFASRNSCDNLEVSIRLITLTVIKYPNYYLFIDN